MDCQPVPNLSECLSVFDQCMLGYAPAPQDPSKADVDNLAAACCLGFVPMRNTNLKLNPRDRAQLSDTTELRFTLRFKSESF